VRNTNAHMLDALRAGRPADTSGEDNLKTYALVEAAYESASKHAGVSAKGLGLGIGANLEKSKAPPETPNSLTIEGVRSRAEYLEIVEHVCLEEMVQRPVLCSRSAIRSPDGVDSKPNDANHALEPLGFRNRKLATSMPMALQADLGIAGAGRHLVEAALKLFFGA